MKLLFSFFIIISSTILHLNAQDLISGGSNSWIFHTPDGSSNSSFGNLHIAFKLNGQWDWSNQVTFQSTGIANFSKKVGIGIGNNTPSGVLDAKSSNNMRIILNKDNQSSISFIPNISNSWFHISHGLDNSLYFSQGSIVGSTKLMTIKNNGNVGIGTTTPDEKLTVKGKIHTQEVRIDLNGAVAPDYVFNKNYPLQTLKEIETYILNNKHLPEIPSAKEMEDEGLYLKKMNLLLLKKIEELTLYTIQQEKKLEALFSK